MEFSTKLRNLRVQRGLTQIELADALKTSQSSITSWEQARREPDFSTIKRIAAYFNVPLSALLPSSDDIDESYVSTVAESLHQNPKLKLLFDRAKNFSERDLDAVLAVTNAISRERGDND